MKNTLTLTALLALGSVASVHALPFVTGDVSFGSFSPAEITGGTDLSNATGFHFNNFGMLGSAYVNTDAAGDFAPLVGSTATFFDFSFAPLSGGGADIWEIDTANLKFHLDGVSIVQQDTTAIVLLGHGMVTGPGFAPTTGTFHFSAQGATGDSAFSFSADNSVPDSGSTGALFGSALVGLGIWSRRRS